MKNIHALAILVLLLGLTSCLSTVNPIFKEKDLVWEEKLLGTWQKQQEAEQIVVQITRATPADFGENHALRKLKGKTYAIRYQDTEDSPALTYLGFLIKLGNNYYMDYYPADLPIKTDRFYAAHYTKMHTCFRLDFKNDDSFALKQFSDSFLQKLIENKKIRISHEKRRDEFIVTASTEDLQQYLVKYSNVPEAYYETTTYKKVQP